MAKTQVSVQNLASGELSQKVRGRFELPAYQHGLERCDNFITELQGPARYRNGFRHVGHTRRNKKPWLLRFQFSNTQSYGLEFTDGYLRFYKDNGIILETALAITAITKANPGVVTSNGHGYSNGDEVYITGVTGMTGVNGKFFLVANKTSNTFQLTDQDGNNFSTLPYLAYASGGTVARIYEITTPYLEADDLTLLRIAQDADTGYIVHPKYEPRKITRSSHTSWAIALFTRTADFITQKTITAVTQANPAAVTATGHGLSTGDMVAIETVVGMTQLNGKWYTVTKVDADHVTLNGVDSTGYTAYSSAGYIENINLFPSGVSFHQGRLAYVGFAGLPLGFKLSRSPDNNGVTRYDDFTNGTDADHAVEFNVNAEDESAALWIRSNTKFLLIGGYTGIYKVTGGTDDTAISPTTVQVTRISAIGVSNVNPVNYDVSTIYSEQQNLIVRSLDYNILWQNFLSNDKNLISEHITVGGIKQFAFTSGRPDIVWAVTLTGRLIGMTFKIGEDIFGWHRHGTGSTDNYISLVSLSRTNNYNRLWAVIERTVNGATRRYIGYMEDPTVIPEPLDYFTGEDNKTTDLATFLRAEYEAKKYCFHLDSGLSYDGSDSGNSPTTINIDALSGNSINFTAGTALFQASDIGREIRKKAISGVGTGRATIVSITSSTVAVCNITEAFDSFSTIAAGNWFFTAQTITNLDHLEGLTVGIITDGAAHKDLVVSGGQVTLDYQASVVHIGIKYKGILKSMNLEAGGADGPAQTKPKNVIAVGLKFFQTLGAEFGTDIYKMQVVKYRKGNDYGDRPPALVSDSVRVPYSDDWAREKHIYIVQQVPMPCNVQLIMPYVLTDNG